MGAKQPHLILLQVKLDYIPNILAQTGCPANSRLGSREAQSGQNLLFSHFFGFSNIPAKILILEENFCPLKFRPHQDASFPPIRRSLHNYLAQLSRKKKNV